MKRFTVNGEKRKVPAFPHHKNFVYRAKQFFQAKSILTHLTMGKFITLRELYNGTKNNCSIPRVLMIDPTSSCNLRCKGCWAADYAKNDRLSFEKMDDILTQAEKLGIWDCLMTGGEPLLCKADIIKLCAKHQKMTFGVFTNATLIDENFAKEIAKLGNLNMFISIEGTREETDYRRGEGVYDKALSAMDLLRQYDIGFAFSTCYHSKNYKTIASDEFLDFMRAKGAWFGWLFQYMPIGSDSDLSLVCTPEQRAYVQEKVLSYCNKHDYSIIDFWNNGHLAFGCIAAGNGFVHINARGDVEPCAFCHYSDSNIHNTSLAEALRSPFFRAFRKRQPFSDNPLQACPLIDVPQGIVEAVKEGNAYSTHFASPETAQQLADKCDPIAKQWAEIVKEQYKKMPAVNRRNYPIYQSYHRFKKKMTDRKINRNG